MIFLNNASLKNLINLPDFNKAEYVFQHGHSINNGKESHNDMISEINGKIIDIEKNNIYSNEKITVFTQGSEYLDVDKVIKTNISRFTSVRVFKVGRKWIIKGNNYDENGNRIDEEEDEDDEEDDY